MATQRGNTTYESALDLRLSQVPLELLDTNPTLYEELLDIHNALERLAMGNLEITVFPVAPQYISTVKASSPLAITAAAGDRVLELVSSVGFTVGRSVTDLDLASNRILPVYLQ